MKSIKSFKLAIVLFISIILTSLPVFNLVYISNAIDAKDVANKVPITGKSYLELLDVNIINDNLGKIVAFTYNFVNNESQSISTLDYWFKLKTTNGARFSVSQMISDKAKNTIIPGTSRAITFYSRIGSSVNTSSLFIEIIKWDFNKANYESILGQHKINDASYIVKPNSSKSIYINENKTKFEVKSFDSNLGSTHHNLSLELEINNEGNNTIKLPEYSYYIKTSGGLLYKLETSAEPDQSIQPKDTLIKTFTATIPEEVNIKKNQLIIGLTESETNIYVPLITFELSNIINEEKPTDTKDSSDKIGKSITYQNTHGKYGVILNSLQRLPWDDTDIIAADITIVNNDKKTLPIVELTGTFSLDGLEVNVKETKNVKLDKIIGLQKGAQSNTIVYIKVPYTYDFEELEFNLSEKVGENSKSIYDYNLKKSVLSIEVLKVNQSLQLKDIGKRAEINILKANILKGENNSDDLFYSIIEMKNLEKRSVNQLTKLEGYIKTDDGTLYPTQFSNISKTSIRANGQVLISAWGKIPNGLSIEDVELIIGQGILNGELTSSQDKSDGIIRAKQVSTPKVVQNMNTDLVDVDIYPYTLTIKDVYATIAVLGKTGVNLDLEYDLIKNEKYVDILEKGNIIIEIEDINNKLAIFSKKLILDGTQENADESLLLGEKIEKTIIFEDPEIIGKVGSLKKYKLKVYEELQGFKKLIASKEYTWFSK